MSARVGATIGLAALAVALIACRSSEDSAPVGPVVRFHAPAVTVRPGETAQVAFEFEIAKGHHIQANPAARKALVPAAIELTATPMIQAGAPAYPPGHTFKLEGSEWDLMTYNGRLAITVPIVAAADAKPGDHTIEGWFSFQACNRHSCLRPDRLAIALGVRVSDRP